MSKITAIQGTRALRLRLLTPLYDVFMRLFMPETAMRGALAERVAPRPGTSVLDLGCGTGTFPIMLALENPRVSVVGIDPDPDVIALAERKASRSGARLELRVAGAEALPFKQESFDSVTSTLAFHHLPPAVKRAALQEALRVLRPGGRLFILDFGRPEGAVQAIVGYAAGLLDGWATTAENVSGKVPELMGKAGIEDVRETYRRGTLFGTLRLYEGVKRP